MKNINTINKKELKLLPMTFDFVFTDILNREKNVDILESLISIITDIPLEKITGRLKIKTRELELYNKKERREQVDLLLDYDGDMINIELNNNSSRGIQERNLVYLCNVHSRQLERGDNNYSQINKTIQIGLNNFDCGQEKICSRYYLRNESGKILSENIEIISVDMVRGIKMCYTKDEEKKARLCKLLTATSLEEIEEAIGDDLMSKETKGKLVEEIEKRSRDKDIVELYTDYSREEMERNTLIIEAREDGLEQGINQGELKKANEIAKNLKTDGIPFDVISRNTGLSIEEIEKL